MRRIILRCVVNSSHNRRFLRADYFYRPIYAGGGMLNFRIYITYTNPNHFYFGKPYHYNSYSGRHSRPRYDSPSYYRGRYKHDFHSGSHSVRDEKVYRTTRRSDFGSATVRPDASRRPSTSVRKEPAGTSGRRTNRSGSTVRRSDKRNNSSQPVESGSRRRER